MLQTGDGKKILVECYFMTVSLGTRCTCYLFKIHVALIVLTKCENCELHFSLQYLENKRKWKAVKIRLVFIKEGHDFKESHLCKNAPKEY